MAVNRGIFKRERTAWLAVLLYTLFLYATLTVAFDLYVSIFDRIGREAVSAWMNRAFLLAGLALLIFILLKVPWKLGSWVTFLLIALATAFCLQNLTIPAKRFHFFQYAPLTVLCLDAIRFRSRDRFQYTWTLALVTLIGFGDEFIQGLLPDRHFGVLDIVINSVAGLLTLAFIGLVLGEENYPWTKGKQ